MSAPRQPAVPIVLDLGKVKRKRIRKLKRGTGPLLDEVYEAVAAVHDELGDEAESREVVPLVLLYERKRKKRRGWYPW